jgi:hypothetical protein
LRQLDLDIQNEIRAFAGEAIARKIFARLRYKRKATLPDFNILRVGDIILSRDAKRKKVSGIQKHQSTIERFKASSEYASWSHAMLYLGRLHVAESTTLFKVGPLQWKSGVRIAPLIGSPTVDLLVCRRADADATDNYDQFSNGAALYALMNHAISPHGYDYSRIAAIAMSNRGKILRKLGSKILLDAERSVICSEYVLRCLAFGGQMFTDEYDALSPTEFFYPADFACHKNIETFSMKYLSINS